MDPSSTAAESFWNALLGYIRAGEVIPIIGQDVVTVEVDGRSMRLTDAVAAKIAGEFDLDGAPTCLEADNCELTTVLGRVRDPKLREDAKARAHGLIREFATHASIPPSLRHLAEIEGFRLFVVTSIDGMLARHFDDADGLLPWQRPVWHPKAEAIAADLDRGSPFADPVVFQLFGRSSATPDTSALTDEEILEFVTALQNPERRPKKLFDELKQHHLLLIGTGFPDWLARFFLRLLKDEPLSLSTNRTAEYLAEAETADTGSRLAFFLDRFSHKTRLCPCASAPAFIDELHRRWQADQASQDDAPPGGVFISYSRDDLPAVQKIASKLKDAGIPHWFDQQELQPGDPFWRVIERNIAISSVFLPVLSATTRRRTEGHTGDRREIGFWHEWLHAVDCLAGDGIPLRHVVPLVVDSTFDAHEDYLPEPFQQRNIAHAPGGEADDRTVRALLKLQRSKDLPNSP